MAKRLMIGEVGANCHTPHPRCRGGGSDCGPYGAPGSGPRMPEHVNPFTVLAVLQQIAARARLDDTGKQALAVGTSRGEFCSSSF